MIKYKAKIVDFEYYTFYESQEEYLQDYHNKSIGLKKLLLQRAVDSTFSELSLDIYAYMNQKVVQPKDKSVLYCGGEESISKYYK